MVYLGRFPLFEYFTGTSVDDNDNDNDDYYNYNGARVYNHVNAWHDDHAPG
jgi:hypothetical protein